MTAHAPIYGGGGGGGGGGHDGPGFSLKRVSEA